jgi:hypothetical protein
MHSFANWAKFTLILQTSNISEDHTYPSCHVSSMFYLSSCNFNVLQLSNKGLLYLTNYIWVMSFDPWKSQNDWTQWCWTWFWKQITSLFMCTSKGWVLWVTSLEERDVYQLLCKVSSLISIVAKCIFVTQNLQQWNMLLHHWLLMFSHVWFIWQYVCM